MGRQAGRSRPDPSPEPALLSAGDTASVLSFGSDASSSSGPGASRGALMAARSSSADDLVLAALREEYRLPHVYDVDLDGRRLVDPAAPAMLRSLVTAVLTAASCGRMRDCHCQRSRSPVRSRKRSSSPAWCVPSWAPGARSQRRRSLPRARSVSRSHCPPTTTTSTKRRCTRWAV